MLKKYIDNILKWKNYIIVVIVVVILLFVLFNSKKYEKSTSLNDATLDTVSRMSLLGESIRNRVLISTKSDEMEKLKAENAELRNELVKNSVMQSDVEELKSLKRALHFVDDKTASSFISAEIIGKNSGEYYKTFSISAGSKDNVKKDSIVANGDGLVGRIYQISKNYSKAVSIIDSNAPVSFEVLGRSTDTGILNQDIRLAIDKNDNLIKGYMFDINSKIKKGDTVITSGLGLYPGAIPIGTVEQVIPDEQNLLKYILVKPFVDLKNLNKVIIFNKKEV